MATISRLLQIIGLFCRIWSFLYGSFSKETYNFQELTNCSHPICDMTRVLTFENVELLQRLAALNARGVVLQAEEDR